MPSTGGACPSPERYGGGEGSNSNVPLLQRIYETYSRARGSAYAQEWPPTTAVGIENMAVARALTFDGWGTNARLSNECNPAKATAAGLLPRWERILNCPPNPGDPEVVRRARCGARFAQFGVASLPQVIIDVLTAALGPLLVGLTHFDETNATSWWPGLAGTGATVTAFAGNVATITGLTGAPTSAPGNLLTASGFANPGNNGVFTIKQWLSPTSVTVLNPSGVTPDAGGVWALTNPATPWTSTVCHLDVHVTQNVSGYFTVQGGLNVPNAAFYAAVAQIGPVLDQMLPSHMTWDWYIFGQSGAAGWYCDEPDLDTEIFDI